MRYSERVQGFGERQAKFGAEAGAVAPASRPSGRQLDANADHRANAQILGVADDGFQLGEFLHHGNDLLAHLAGQRRHLDELVVLEPIANDRGVVPVGQSQDRQQLGLGTGFQAEVVGLAEIEDFLDHVPLLVDLDGIHAAIGALVAIFGDGRLERLVDFAYPMPQNVGEAKQNRQLDAAFLKLIHQVLQVDRLLRPLVRMNGDVAPLIDAEVTLCPNGEPRRFPVRPEVSSRPLISSGLASLAKVFVEFRE